MAGRRVRTPIPPRFGAAAVSAAAALALVVAAVIGPTGASAAPDTPVDLAAAVHAVSDPHSARYRHFWTPEQIAPYLPVATRASTRSAGFGTHLVYPQGLAATGGGCSKYFGEFAASSYPAMGGVVAPLAVCGYTPSQLRSAYDTHGDTGNGVTVAVLGAYASPTMPGDADRYAQNHGDARFADGQYEQEMTPGGWNLQATCEVDSWAAEETLDVEAVHAMAPRASVLYVGADSCQDSDMLAALGRIVANREADVVTASWGSPLHETSGDEPADVIAVYERLFQLAALEGITVDFAAGDCGANSPDSGCGAGSGSTRPQTTFPASDPWVTAVGGTSVAIGSDGETLWQSAWGTRAWRLRGTGWEPMGWVFGGGGGAAEDFARPWYQAGRVPDRVADTLLTGASATTPRRVVPDLSLDADPFTGMLIGQTRPAGGGPAAYGESAIGGTSLAAPLLAGLEADMAARATNGGRFRGLGFLNPVLYLLAGTRYIRDVAGDVGANGQVYPSISGVPAVFTEFGDDAPLAATPGYDTATGLGTPGDDFTAAVDRFIDG
jgi:subtilase family serine protease